MRAAASPAGDEKQVKSERVDDERRQQREGEGHKAVEEQQRPDKSLCASDEREHIARLQHSEVERDGGFGQVRRRRRHDVEQTCRADGEQEQAQQKARDDGKVARERLRLRRLG